jgi:hypothetical protein
MAEKKEWYQFGPAYTGPISRPGTDIYAASRESLGIPSGGLLAGAAARWGGGGSSWDAQAAPAPAAAPPAAPVAAPTAPAERPKNRTAILAAQAAAPPVFSAPAAPATPEIAAAQGLLRDSPIQAMVYGPTSEGGYTQGVHSRNAAPVIQAMGAEMTPEQQAWVKAHGVSDAAAAREPVRVIEGQGGNQAADERIFSVSGNRRGRGGSIREEGAYAQPTLTESFDLPQQAGGYINAPSSVVSAGKTAEYIQALAKGAEVAADPLSAKLAAELEKQRLVNEGDIAQQRIATGGGIEQSRIGAKATVDAATVRRPTIIKVEREELINKDAPAMGTRKVTDLIRDNGDGTITKLDPETGQPIGTAVAAPAGGAAKPGAKTPNAAQLARLKQNRNNPAEIKLFEDHFGPGTAAQYLK